MRLSIGSDRLIELGEALEVELVGVPLAVDLGHDVLIVVVAERTAELVVIHVRLVFPLSPLACHLVWVDQFELAVCALPSDTGRVLVVGQKL